jgi:hypothetical protein
MELMKGESQGIARGRESASRAKILKKGLATTRQELRFPRISKNMTGADKMMCDKEDEMRSEVEGCQLAWVGRSLLYRLFCSTNHSVSIFIRIKG